MSLYSYGYKREPPAVKKLRKVYLWKVEQAKKEGRAEWKSFEETAKQYLGMVQKTFVENGEEVIRWCKILPFKASKQQVSDYLRWKQTQCGTKGERDKYAVPKNIKTKKETTGKDELKRIYIKTKDPVIKRVLAIRSLNKMLTNDLPNWEPKEDGRVHSTFGYSPPTGQFNASNPNVLNASKHTPLGQVFRRMIVAPEGYKLVELDYSRFHIATMGREAKDPSYIRFGRLDSHTIFTAQVVGRPISMNWEDEKIIEAVKEIKKNPEWLEARNKKYKHVVLGNQLGLGARRLWYQHREAIESEDEAKKLQKVIADLFPKVERFKGYITRVAHNQRFLRNEFGFRREFFDVIEMQWDHWERKWEERHGPDYEKALSFLVQSNAFGMLREKLLTLERLGYLERFGFVNTVHDSLVFLPAGEQVEELRELVVPILEAPCKRLANEACPEGLAVGVDFSVGKNWANYSQVNLEGMREC